VKNSKGVVVAGCPYCKKLLHSMNEFIEHNTLDVLPRLFEMLENKRQ